MDSQTDKPIITLMLTDDHPMVRDGLTGMLSMQPHFKLLGAYGKASHLMEGLRGAQPDILLLDLQLPDTNGEELMPRLREMYPEMHIIILTANSSIYSIKLLLNQGARGYLLKNLEQELLAEAIERVYEGEIFLSSDLQMRLLKLNKSQNRVTAGDLTPREIEILKLITEEYTTQEIADHLHISFKTVENYRMSLMQKLDVKNMVGMTKKAILMGITT